MQVTVIEFDEKNMREIVMCPALSRTDNVYIIFDDGKTKRIIGTGKWKSAVDHMISIAPDDNVIENYLVNEPMFKDNRDLLNVVGGMSFDMISGERFMKFGDEDDTVENYYNFSIVGQMEYRFGICYNFTDIEPLDKEAEKRVMSILQHRKTK